MDLVDRFTRSLMMSKIRNKNTKPEQLIRKKLFKIGFRYRINVRTLFGTPDIVLPKFRSVIFIHGCFWHGHDCHLFRLPETRRDFWRQKIEINRERDAKVLNRLHAEGWRICIVWECAIKGESQMQKIDCTISTIAHWLKSEEIWLEVRK